jgi:hypothetical protein
MKYFFLALVLSIFYMTAFSQVLFEGKVTHLVTTQEGAIPDTLEIFYGKQKIISVSKAGKPGRTVGDDIIIDFSKELVYYINVSKKTYTKNSLRYDLSEMFLNFFRKTGEQKTILNYRCSAYTISDSGKIEKNKDIDLLFWYSDSLFYPLSKKYKHSPELYNFTNGETIAMGITMSFGRSSKIAMVPVLVQRMELNEALFEIPIGYTLRNDNPSNSNLGLITIKDSISDAKLEVDKTKNISIPPPPPPFPPPLPKEKNKKKNAAKSPSNHKQ